MKRSALGASAAFILVPALFLAGCGSDKPSSTSSPSSSSTPTASDSPTTSSDLTPVNGDGFTVSLPGTPQESDQTFDTPAGALQGKAYTSEGAGGQFIVALVPYPSSSKLDLDKEIEGAATAFDGTVASNTTIDLDGHDARQAKVTGTSEGVAYDIYVIAADVDGKLFEIRFAIKSDGTDTPPAILGEVAQTLSFS